MTAIRDLPLDGPDIERMDGTPQPTRETSMRSSENPLTALTESEQRKLDRPSLPATTNEEILAAPIEPFPVRPVIPVIEEITWNRELSYTEVTFFEQLRYALDQIDPLDAAAAILPLAANIVAPGSGLLVARLVGITHAAIEKDGVMLTSQQENLNMGDPIVQPPQQTKPWYMSLTIIGVLVTAISYTLSIFFGVSIDHEEQAVISQSLLNVLEAGGMLLGLVMSVIGRIRAKGNITATKTPTATPTV